MAIRYNEDGSLTDGIYDDQNTHCRERFVNGIHTHTVSHLWINDPEEEARARLPEDWMKEPFGTFPQLPKMKKFY
jgi:hypothetical protein